MELWVIKELVFQANSTPADGEVIQGITFCPHSTAIGRARAGIAALANGSSHPQSGADLTFMTRYSADGHDLDVTTDQRLRIDVNGDFFFNTPTLSGMALWNMTGNDQRARYQFWQKTGTYRGAVFHEDRGDGNAFDIILSKSRGGNGTGVITSGDSLGKISFAGADGTRCVNSAYIASYTEGTIASNRIPSRLIFGTHKDAAGGLATQMTIRSTGRIGIGIDAPEAVLHPRANPDHGTDIAFQVGSQSGARYFQLSEISGQDNFSNCIMSFYDNSLREILTLQNTYSGQASMGNQIVWRGHGGAKTGDIRVYNTAVNSSQSKMDMSASGGIGLAIDHNGYVTKPNHPAFMINGGNNLYNNTDSNVFLSGNTIYAPQSSVNNGNAVHVDTKSAYTVSNGKYTIPVAGIWHFHACGTTGSNSSHFVQITVNGSGVAGELHLEYAGGSTHMNFGISGTYNLSSGDYVEFRRRGSGYTFYSLSWGGYLVG